jgi:adenine-specific DNA-methyltransferase
VSLRVPKPSAPARERPAARPSVEEALARFARDARSRLGSTDSKAAFSLWRETATGEQLADDAAEVFASEAGFAAAARLLLELEVGRPGRDLERTFPHLYGSPLFSWYEAPPELAAALGDAIARRPHDDPVSLLGWLYQFSIPDRVRSRFGHFTGPRVLSSRLLDPACGAGAFVIEATRRILAQAQKEGLTDAEACAAVQRTIHGLDLNPLGVLLGESAIGLLLAPYLCSASEGVEPLRLYVTDTLRVGEPCASGHDEEAETLKGRLDAYASGFDVVCANPPYAKYPSRLLTPRQAERFAATTYGHPNLYGLFLQVGVELLAEEGRLVFITPKSFVSGRYFKNLRRFLVRHLDLERFDTFQKRTGLFQGVLQEVVILTAAKTARRSATVELREFADTPARPPARAIRVARDSVLLGEEFEHAFFVSADETAHSVLSKMLERGTPLRELGYRVATGTIVWNRLQELVRDGASPSALPLIWGNGIRAFRFLGPGNRAGKGTHLKLTPKTRPLAVRGEALLVKRMTAREERRRLVCCRLPAALAASERGWFAENHVNVIAGRPDAPVELDALLGLLNSKLFDYLFRALNGNTQVSASELERFPIAQGRELARIAELARQLSDGGGRATTARAQLDAAVYALYGLEEKEVAAIEAAYPTRALATGRRVLPCRLEPPVRRSGRESSP